MIASCCRGDSVSPPHAWRAPRRNAYMCGIAGRFLLDRSADVDAVRAVLRMRDAPVHRGPTDWGILIPEATAQSAAVRSVLESRGLEHVRTYPAGPGAPSVVLGARRLSIIDLSPRGRMPMGTAESRLWVSFNGEIYNFRELRDELRERGFVFESDTDTETILHGYEEWGPDVVSHLRGMFSFVVFDARRPDAPRLFLARDRFGIKPMYWARRDSTFHFASEVRALMAGGAMPNEPEPRGFHGFLVHGSVPSPWTTVRDVFSLPSAHDRQRDVRRGAILRGGVCGARRPARRRQARRGSRARGRLRSRDSEDL